MRNSKPGTRNDTLNRSAFALGTLVASGHLDEESVVSALTDAALITTPNAKDDDPLADHEIAAGAGLRARLEPADGLRVERGRITPPKPGFWGDGAEAEGLWF